MYIYVSMFIVAQYLTFRPKLFGVWGALVPVGKAVTSLLSTFLDSHKKGTTMNNVTIEEVSPPRHECAQANEGKESESHLKSGMLVKTYTFLGSALT